MAETVGSHTIATFTSPVNGTTPIDANTVRGNDNVIQTAYNAHDTDTGIHVQSSALASRPAAGTAGRKWITVDGTVQRLWYDTGSVWLEVQAAALSTARTLWGQSFDGSANVSGSLSSVTDIGMSGTLTIGGDVALSRGAANRLDLATGDNLNLVNGAYLIGAASVLSATTLGSSVVNSSLTSVGTLTSGAIGSGFSPIANSALANSSVTVNGVSIALGASGTVAAAAGTLTGTTLASNVVTSSLTSVGTLVNLTVTNPISGSVTGSAGSVAASALTGTTLASGVTASSLTSVGTLTSLTVAAKVSANNIGSSVSGFSDYLNGGAWDILGASTAGSASTLAIGGYRSSQWIGINFYTGGVSRALIDNSGNLAVDTNTLFVDAANNRVGVGTASPATGLHLLGVASANADFTHETVSAGTAARTRYLRNGSLKFLAGLGAYTGGDTYEIAGPSAAFVTIDASGNLGLGVTPSAHSLSGYGGPILQVGARGSILGSDTTSAYANNTYYSAGFFRYIANDEATMLEQKDGAFRFFTATSGTAGDPITFTQAMTLTANGNLTIGGTTESARVRIEGATNLSTALQLFRSGNSCGAIWQEASAMRFGTDGSTGFTEKLRIDNTTTAGQTALLLWDVDNNTLERVTVGAADSGGTGFKVLRIPN